MREKYKEDVTCIYYEDGYHRFKDGKCKCGYKKEEKGDD
jgi:hypothetical protein